MLQEANVLPEITLYSSFRTELARSYAVTMLVFILLGTLVFMNKWSAYDKKDKLQSLFRQQKHPISALVFGNSWDWNFDQKGDKKNNASLLEQEYRRLIDTERVKKE
jgi:hypothetical protein